MTPAYNDEAAQKIYELLFCDNLALFEALRPHLPELFDAQPDFDKLQELAEDEQAESRLRSLAFRRLRELGRPAPSTDLLGIIFEYATPMGLDTLALYADGNARYINYGEGLSVLEDTPPQAKKEIFKLARPVLALAQTPTQQHGEPLEKNQARLTFLLGGELFTLTDDAQKMFTQKPTKPLLEQLGALLGFIVQINKGL